MRLCCNIITPLENIYVHFVKVVEAKSPPNSLVNLGTILGLASHDIPNSYESRVTYSAYTYSFAVSLNCVCCSSDQSDHRFVTSAPPINPRKQPEFTRPLSSFGGGVWKQDYRVIDYSCFCSHFMSQVWGEP